MNELTDVFYAIISKIHSNFRNHLFRTGFVIGWCAGGLLILALQVLCKVMGWGECK